MIVFDKAINAGSDYANFLGFTSDKFEGYLWQKEQNVIMISLVLSVKPASGNFSAFIKGLIEKGYTVKVPIPFNHMLSILKHMGFEQTFEQGQLLGRVEVWVLRP